MRGLRLPRPLLPVEVRGGADGDERRPGAAAAGDERAHVEPGRARDLPPPQGDRGAGVGQIKNTVFRGFGVRGMSRVAGEFSLVCAAHNIKKMVGAAIRGSVRPEFGRRAAMA